MRCKLFNLSREDLASGNRKAARPDETPNVALPISLCSIDSARQQTHGIDKFSLRTNKFKNAALHELLKMNRMLLPVLFCKNGNHRPSDDYSTDDCTCIGAFNRGAGMKQTIIKQLKILYSDRQYIDAGITRTSRKPDTRSYIEKCVGCGLIITCVFRMCGLEALSSAYRIHSISPASSIVAATELPK